MARGGRGGAGRGVDPGTDAGDELQHWRAQVFGGVAWTTIAAAAIVLAAVWIFRAAPSLLAWALGALVGTLVPTVVFGGRLGYRTAVGVFFVAVYAFAMISIARMGFAPNSVVLLETLVFISTLLLGRRSALAMIALHSGSMLALWLLHGSGAIGRESMFVPVVPDDWRGILRVVLSYAGLSGIGVVAASFLLDRARASLASKTRALEALRREQAEADRLRDELRRRDEALAKARELEILGRLAGSVAHDFNNALLIIQLNADLLRYAPASLPSALEDIRAAVQQAASTTRQLRGLQRQTPMPPVRIELREAVTRTVQLLQRLLPSNIAIKVAADEQVVVVADEGQLHSVLTNLALNARDAMPEGGVLEMRVKRAQSQESARVGLDGGDFAIIEVEDNGVGISPETKERLFEPYFTTKGDEGTGLGLASVKTIVEAHGGRIVVSSELGRGTELRIFWPLADKTEPTALEPRTGPTRGDATVLLVEDDALILSAVAATLRQRGFTVLTASEGADAMVVARRHHGPIDLLCSDCLIPGPPLRQLVEHFRDAYPAAKVILCSGHAPQEIGAALPFIDAFVPKPFSPDALAALMSDLAGRARQTGMADFA